MRKVASQIYQEHGYKGYFNGFAKASIPRIALAGAITQSIISFVNGTFEKWKEAKI